MKCNYAHKFGPWKRVGAIERRECCFCPTHEERPLLAVRPVVNSDGTPYGGPEYSLTEEKLLREDYNLDDDR